MIRKNKYTIAIAGGELADGIQKYLRGFGVPIDMSPDAKMCQQYGSLEFRIARSRDVPKFLGRWDKIGIRADFGITGYDCCYDESLAGGSFKYFSLLTSIGEGRLVLFTKKGVDLNVLENPVMAVSDYYTNIAKSTARFKKLKCNKILEVKGKVEGYVSAGEAGIGLDSCFTGETIKTQENLEIKEEVMKTCAAVICRPEYIMTMQDFISLLYNYNKH